MTAVGIALASGYDGLPLSWHDGARSGLAIIMVASAACALSIFTGPQGGVLRRRQRTYHRHG